MAGRTAYLRRARHWLANRGVTGLLQELWYRAQLTLQGKPVPGRENSNTAPHPFDVRYGVDTGGLLWGEALDADIAQSSAFWATGYYGISPSAFTAALEKLSLDWASFSFVDIGCGKGRAMLLALRFRFHQVLGIELSTPLATIAQHNLEIFHPEWRQSGVPTHAVQGDATLFPLPRGPLVLFLYHPFAAPAMQRFLEHLTQALEEEPHKQVFLLYANPELTHLVSATQRFELMWKENFALTPEEGAADRFGSYGEVFAAFRSTNPA